MNQRVSQWLQQAEYDFDTAEVMHQTGRHFYGVFMAHLAVEKALKALFLHKLGKEPPRTHNLSLLLTRIGLNPAMETRRFVIKLNEASVATRYPSDLDRLQARYKKDVVEDILRATKDTLQWIRTQF